jgi:hypothetical protein
MWSASDVRFELIDDLSGDPVVTIEIATPQGTILIMGEPRISGRTMIAASVHMHGVDVGANAIGAAVLRVVADAFLREMDLDELVIEGALRTTGTKPGSRPRPLRFARRGRASSRLPPG